MDSDRRRKLADADLFLSRSLVDEKVARMAALPAYEQIDRDGDPLLDCHADFVEEVVDLPFDTDCDYPCMAENLESFPDLYPDGLYGTAPPGGHMLNNSTPTRWVPTDGSVNPTLGIAAVVLGT